MTDIHATPEWLEALANPLDIEAIAENAPTLDWDTGRYGDYSPTLRNQEASIYYGLTVSERRELARLRRPMTEAPKCGAWFSHDMAHCDAGLGSHECAPSDSGFLGWLAAEVAR